MVQCVGQRVKGTDTIFCVDYIDIPNERQKDITDGRIVVDYRPQKEDPNHTRLIVGGNIIDYPGYLSTPTADTNTSNIAWNSVVSTPKAKYMCIDIINFYLGTPQTRYEYLCIAITLILDNIIQKYNLLPLVRNGLISFNIHKGMYGLPQTGRPARNFLTEHLVPKVFPMNKHTRTMDTQMTPILFFLVLDDFGIKYVGKEHAKHLISAIRKFYPVSEYWSGILYF